MKRMKIVGLCIVAAFALAALVGAGSASAAQFNVCVPFKKGEYTTSSCSTKSVKAHKGAFEKEVGGACYPAKKAVYSDAGCTTVAEKKGKPSHKGHFEKANAPATVTGGHAELVGESGVKIECTASSGSQELTGAKTQTGKTTFSNCTIGGPTGPKCQSALEPGGTITTKQLAGELANTLAVSGVSIRLLPATGSVFALFNCTGVGAIQVTGGPLGGELTPIGSYVTSENTAFLKGFEQTLKSAFGASEAGPFGAPEGSEQLGSVTASGADAVEIEK